MLNLGSISRFLLIARFTAWGALYSSQSGQVTKPHTVYTTFISDGGRRSILKTWGRKCEFVACKFPTGIVTSALLIWLLGNVF